jgi:hypothetical protein
VRQLVPATADGQPTAHGLRTCWPEGFHNWSVPVVGYVEGNTEAVALERPLPAAVHEKRIVEDIGAFSLVQRPAKESILGDYTAVSSWPGFGRRMYAASSSR